MKKIQQNFLFVWSVKFQFDEQLGKLEFYIAFASKLGGATGLNRIVKGC